MKAKGIFVVAAIALLAVVGSFKLFASANSFADSFNFPQSQANPSNAPVPPSDPAERDAYFTRTIEASFGPTKKVEVTDPFYNGMVAYTVTIPKDWVFEGTVLHGPGCMGLDYQGWALRAYSPDAAFGVQIIPQQSMYYWEDPRASADGANCKFFAPISSADYASMYAYRMRPNVQIDLNEPGKGAEQIYAIIEKRDEDMAEKAQRMRMPPEHDSGDFTRTRIHYDWEGFSEEEWLAVIMTYREMPKSVFIYDGGPHPGHPEWRFYLQTDATLTARRAPKGKLDQFDPALVAISSSLTFNPDFVQVTQAHQWDQARRNIAAMWQVTHSIIQASQTQMMITQQNSQAFRSTMDAISQQHQQFMANMQRQGDIRHQNFMGQMDARTAHTRDFQDYLLDQQYYVNPQTGQTATVSGRSTHTWANGPMNSNATSVVQSPNPNYNPNVSMTGNWTELVPIHH
jgi:hypothetical protein